MTIEQVNHRVNPGDEFQDIGTAPRDGTVVEVMDPDCGTFPMRWNPEGINLLVSDERGIWECPGGNFTWSEHDGAGPRFWRPYKPGRYLS